MLRSWWSDLGLWTGSRTADERDFHTAVFSLRLPRTPSRVWDMAALSRHPSADDAPEGPYPALQGVWQQLVLETLVVILGWRRSRYDPERAWTAAQAAAIHVTSCQRVLALLSRRRADDAKAPPLHALLIAELREAFSREAQPPLHQQQPG
jgi:hypothetical protein